MSVDMTRTIVETVVKKAIRELRTDPERALRNLLDMALTFTDSRFQTQFFGGIRKLLDNESSGYYVLTKETLTKINEETLLTFAMNLGYNGLYRGAAKIRDYEAKNGSNIPWVVSLTINSGKLYDRHYQIIDQGQALGIHSWHLFSNQGLEECLTLAGRFPESAFVFFCEAAEIDDALVDHLADARNIAVMVSFDTNADEICRKLRNAGVLYGLHFRYTRKDLTRIESGELLQEMEQLHPAVSILLPRPDCRQLQRHVHGLIQSARLEQKHCTLPFDLYGDVKTVDEVISEDPCWVGFDSYGQLCTEAGVDHTHGRNIFLNDLPVILAQAFPKHKGVR